MKSKAIQDANDTQAIIRRYMSDLGKKGGAVTKAKGKEHFIRIGKLGGRPRKIQKDIVDKSKPTSL